MSTREGENKQRIDELLRNFGEEPILREAETMGLSPKGKRMRCPFAGCADKGKDRERDAQLYAGHHPRLFCFACGTKGDLIDVLQLARGWSKAEAITHLTGVPVAIRQAPQLRLVSHGSADDPDKLTPAEVSRIWEGMAREDDLGQKYLEGRGLGDAIDLGLVRFATEQHPDKGVASSARRGYRIAVLVTDVVGNARGIQLRKVSEPRAREPKILSVKGSSSSKAFFGLADHIEAEPIIAVAEGLADTLALSAWARDRAGVAVVGAAGKNSLPKLAEELEAAGIPLADKIFALFPQNDRPKNHSRREFVRLGQMLTKLGARAVMVQTDDEFKDLAEWLRAKPDAEWPPRELDKAIIPEPGDESSRENKPVLAPGSAVPLPASVKVDNFANNFTTLCAILDDPMHRETVAGTGDLTWCEMTWRVRIGGRELAEHDFSTIRLGLESHHRSTDGKPLKFSEEDIGKALAMLARRKVVHPLRDWVSSLAWDGKERVAVELPCVLGHEPGGLAATFLTRWMISAIARAMQPGCKVDTVLVLVGDQGARKSSFFDALGGAWFTDSPVQVGDDNGKQLMRQVWIIEWAELDAMRRARDQEATKAFLSARVDIFRKPYAREHAQAPRHCVIVGTTNNGEFLHDSTGSRRFWPIQVAGRIDMDWVKAHREQLWAEALHRYRAGEQWWLTDEEDQIRAAAAVEHEASHPWTEVVSDWLRDKLFAEVTATQILVESPIAMAMERVTPRAEVDIGRVMKSLGWERKRRRAGGGLRWVYVSPEVGSFA